MNTAIPGVSAGVEGPMPDHRGAAQRHRRFLRSTRGAPLTPDWLNPEVMKRCHHSPVSPTQLTGELARALTKASSLCESEHSS